MPATSSPAPHDSNDAGHRGYRFNMLRVADVRRETPDAVSIAFSVPDDLVDSYRFQAGQHLTIRHDANGEELRRCYSISSGPGDAEMRIVVKQIDDGVFSTFANTQLKPGMELDVMTPSGTFCPDLDPAAGAETNYLLVAAGSGITPVISIARAILTTEPQSKVTLFYVNQRTGSIIYRGALSDLKDKHPTRLSVVHMLSREKTDVPLYSGRLDADKLKSFVPFHFEPGNIDQAFLCGPAEMVENLRDGLNDLGLDRSRIHSELFTPAEGIIARPKPAAPKDANPEGVQVTAILDGVERDFILRPEDDNIVGAARAAGVELPFSCSNGMCATCRAKLIEGEVEMAANYSLEPWEVEAGYVLTCQSRPKSAKIKVDYDQI